jgi:hypothetical protein
VTRRSESNRLLQGLRDTRVPGEAEERAWRVVRAAFAAREPVRAPRRRLAPVVALAAVVAAAGVLASPPGWALIHAVREAVGVKKAKPELFSLPAPGRLLVESARGLWVIRQDGSRRLLGGYEHGAWSPHGLFLSATRRNELLALDSEGHVRWALPRPVVRFPSWTGTRTDTRIAYLTTSRLHVVAGDGTGDVDALALPAAALVAPAWRPGLPHVLAYVDRRGRVFAFDVAAGSDLWHPPVISGRFLEPRQLQWSGDGQRLLLVARDKLVLFGLQTATPLSVRVVKGIRAAAFRPRSRELAVLRVRAGGSEVLLGRRVVFRGTGEFSGLTWSPDGHWLLVTWPTADQWVFVRVAGPRRIVAVSGIRRQLGGGATVAGWCCR